MTKEIFTKNEIREHLLEKLNHWIKLLGYSFDEEQRLGYAEKAWTVLDIMKDSFNLISKDEYWTKYREISQMIYDSIEE